jgi:CubicO group peptidase (beta-lactamase class C family)
MSPEDYSFQVFDRLGISKEDHTWSKNADGLSIAFPGLRMTATALSKLGMLYLQGGFVNPDEQVISQERIAQTFTVGDENANVPFGYMWWIDTEQGIYCSKGLGGRKKCTSPEKDRAIVISSRNHDQRLWEWLEGDDAAPQDQLVNIFLGE